MPRLDRPRRQSTMSILRDDRVCLSLEPDSRRSKKGSFEVKMDGAGWLLSRRKRRGNVREARGEGKVPREATREGMMKIN